MKKTRTFAGLALATTLALGACSDESTAPDLLEPALTYHAALIAADATLEDIALAQAPFGFGPGAQLSFGSGQGGMGQGGMGQGGMGQMGRPGGQHGVGGAFSGTRSVTFYDEKDQEQTAYDALTTAKIHYVMEVGGDVTRGPWSGTVSRKRDMTVSGLLGEETTRVHNGSGSESVKRSRTLEDGLEATFDMEGTFVQTNLEVPIPGSQPRYPLSGTIQRTMKVTVVNGPTGDVTRDVSVLITFDGDNTATAVVNGTTYEIDLDARQGGHALRGGFGGGHGG